MSNVFHFPEKWIKTLAKGFDSKSLTDSMIDHDIDQEFSGVRTVHETYLATVPLNKYNRFADPSNTSRFGPVTEIGDIQVTYEMSDDVSYDISYDRGNSEDQLNNKRAGAITANQSNEVVVPYLDKYRMQKWADEAGNHYALTAALAKDNIVEAIINAKAAMEEDGVPSDGLTLSIPIRHIPKLKLADEFAGLDSIAKNTLVRGQIGEFDGMVVKKWPSKKFPKNAEFMITHKSALSAPKKIKTMRIITDDPNMDGNRINFRMYHDAFVRARKADAVLVATQTANIVKAPTFAASGNSVTISCATSGATIYYTLNDSDPRFSDDRKVYTSAVTLADGDVLKAYAAKDGLYSSAVSVNE